MSQQTVLIEFTSNADGLAPAEKGLQNLNEQEKKLAEQSSKTAGQMEQSNNKVASSITKMAEATKTLDKSVIGATYQQ